MWTNRAVFEEHDARMHAGNVERARLLAENIGLRESNKVLQTNMDWMRMRMTQLEKQNAQYIYQIAGVKVPTPEFVPAINLADAASTMSELADVFEDMSDERASKLGISLTPDGLVKYPD